MIALTHFVAVAVRTLLLMIAVIVVSITINCIVSIISRCSISNGDATIVRVPGNGDCFFESTLTGPDVSATNRWGNLPSQETL